MTEERDYVVRIEQYHVCTLCGEHFKEHEELKKHVHSGPLTQDLPRHAPYDAVINYRKFACTKCSWKGTSNPDRHVIIAHPKKPWKCSHCDFESKNHTRYVTHAKFAHCKQ